MPAIGTGGEEFYEYDGTGNNLIHPSWGAAKTNRLREYPPMAAYVDGIGIPRTEETVENLPSARRIMESLFRKANPHPDKKTNHLLVEMGLFITTDATRSAGATGGGTTAESSPHSMPIPCDGMLTEYKWCPGLGKNFSIPFQRTIHNTTSIPRHSINLATSFLDLSNIYGMEESYAKQTLLRKGGKLPLDENGLPQRDEQTRKYILSDSKRCTLSPGVFSLFTIFMRYHNLRAQHYYEMMMVSQDEELAVVDEYDDTDWLIFQRARMDTIAVFQSIVEQKYVPSLIGQPLDDYKGYDATVNPSVDVFFTTVAMRYGHTALPGILRLLDSQFQSMPRDPLLLRDVILKVSEVMDWVTDKKIEPVLRGLVVNPAKAVDASVVDDMNIFNAASVMDIQRGRDSGIPPFNTVRQAFGMAKFTSYEELVDEDEGDDEAAVASILEELYGPDGIDLVDSIVGALLEKPQNGSLLGPVFTWSLKNQFQRLRDGDRLWWKNRLDAEEIDALPTLSELIKLVAVDGEDMERFPLDPFLVFDARSSSNSDSCPSGADEHSISLLSGLYEMSWDLPTSGADDDEQTLEVLIAVHDKMEGPGGYVGVGWKSHVMKNAEIWFCQADPDLLASYQSTISDACGPTSQPEMFSCCLATGDQSVPQCASNNANTTYPIEVKGWCLSNSKVEVLASVPLCSEEGDTYCFDAGNGTLDFIAAYNLHAIAAHGPYNRAAGFVDLWRGSYEAEANHSTDQTGFFAAHGMFMLFNWMILVPASIYIARYMKTRSWRIVAHISLMSCVGSLMIPIVTTTELVAPDSSDKYGEHRVVGLLLAGIYFLMAVTGRLRYLILEGQRNTSWFASVFAVYFHRVVGLSLMLLAFWNCYTGLVRIGPDDTYVEVITVNSVPLGYNVTFFSTLRDLYWPYVGFVLLIFAYAEVQEVVWKYKKKDPSLNIWGNDDANKYIERISLKMFLEMTGNGRELCIVDGRVLDLNKFQDFHPGGRHVLRFAHGSDITEEYFGRRDVDGKFHRHSPAAHRLIRKLVTAILDEPSEGYEWVGRGLGSVQNHAAGDQQVEEPFKRARVVGIQYLTPALAKAKEEKATVLLRLAVPVTQLGELSGRQKWLRIINRSALEFQMPRGACTFVFRGRDILGGIVERQFTPLQLDPTFKGNRYSLFSSSHDVTREERSVDFLITLLPGGKMSKLIQSMKPGRSLLMQGPRINPDTDAKIRKPWKAVVMFAAGTGLAPVLQVAHQYIVKSKGWIPSMFLVWVVKSAKHCYLEETGIEKLAERAGGRFRWIVLYSSRTKSSERDSVEVDHRSSSGSGFLATVAQRGFLSAISTSLLAIAAKPIQSGNPTVGSFLQSLRFIKSLKFDQEKIKRYQESGDTSDALWSTWRHGGVFLGGRLNQDFVVGVFRAVATNLEDLEEGPERRPSAGEGAAVALEDISEAHAETLVLESGPPTFDATILQAMRELGLKGHQIVSFPHSTTPLPSLT